MDQFWKKRSSKKTFMGDSSDDDESIITVIDEPKTKTIATQTEADNEKDNEVYEYDDERLDPKNHRLQGSPDQHAFRILDVILSDIELVNDLKETLEKEKIIRKLIIHKMGLIRKMVRTDDLNENDINEDNANHDQCMEVIDIMIQIEALEERLKSTVEKKIKRFERLRDLIFT